MNETSPVVKLRNDDERTHFYTGLRPVAKLIERQVHMKNMQASGHAKYNLMCLSRVY